MEKKKIYILGIIGVLFVLTIVGISYAYWLITFQQPENNIVVSDCFNITFSGENSINLQNAYPMDDDELYLFYGTATPYHFTITNTCNSKASGYINLEVLNSEKKLDDSYIDVILYEGKQNYLNIARAKSENKYVYSLKKEGHAYKDINIYDYSLINNSVNVEKVIEESLTAYKLTEFTLSALETKEYNLLEYVSSDTPANEDTTNATFGSKITVTAKYENVLAKNLLRERTCAGPKCPDDPNVVFQSDYVNNATSIVFENTVEAPSDYLASFDESEMQDKSIMAYVIENADNPGTYTIRFQTDGVFLMPENSNSYFSYFSNVSSIDGLENVDTSRVTNMSAVFSEMNNLTSLDVSHFDTSNVTDMSDMFRGLSALTNLDVTHFDTSNVTNMGGMFSYMSSLNNLDVSHFDTSKVTDMSDMFRGLSALTNLDVTHFDTSNVTIMYQMFAEMSSLTSLDVTHFDTSKVTDMSGMFYYMSNLTSLNVANFDTSNVVGMSQMFERLSSLTSLDVTNFDTSNVVSMVGMFQGMSSLTSLDVTHFNTSNVTEMQMMFSDMKNISSLDLSHFDTSSVRNMSQMFAGDSKLMTIVYGSNFVRKNGSYLLHMFQDCPANVPTDASWEGADF